MKIQSLLSGRLQSHRFRKSSLAVVRLSNKFNPAVLSRAAKREGKSCPVNSWTLHSLLRSPFLRITVDPACQRHNSLEHFQSNLGPGDTRVPFQLAQNLLFDLTVALPVHGFFPFYPHVEPQGPKNPRARVYNCSGNQLRRRLPLAPAALETGAGKSTCRCSLHRRRTAQTPSSLLPLPL